MSFVQILNYVCSVLKKNKKLPNKTRKSYRSKWFAKKRTAEWWNGLKHA